MLQMIQRFSFCVLACSITVCCHTTESIDTSPLCEEEWGWYDEVTGLCWENPGVLVTSGWEYADKYCDGLSLGDHVDWRLPTISELRSLIRDCSATMTAGACNLTDTCINSQTCWNDPCWIACDDDAGTGVAGCYWEAALGDCHLHDYFDILMCGDQFWSSSPVEGNEDSNGWSVEFVGGGVFAAYKVDCMLFLCVRSAP